jgi:hypothetical protein
VAKRSRRDRRFSVCLAAVAGLALACSSEEERPPPYVSPAIDDPKSCFDLRTNGVLGGSEIRIDGKRANCAAEGLECTLRELPTFSGLCDAGQSAAICRTHVWQFACVTSGDAGTDGGP